MGSTGRKGEEWDGHPMPFSARGVENSNPLTWRSMNELENEDTKAVTNPTTVAEAIRRIEQVNHKIDLLNHSTKALRHFHKQQSKIGSLTKATLKSLAEVSNDNNEKPEEIQYCKYTVESLIKKQTQEIEQPMNLSVFLNYPKYFIIICNLLQSATGIRSIQFDDTTLTTNLCKHVVSILKFNKEVTELVLNRTTIKESDLQELGFYITENNTLLRNKMLHQETRNEKKRMKELASQLQRHEEEKRRIEQEMILEVNKFIFSEVRQRKQLEREEAEGLQDVEMTARTNMLEFEASQHQREEKERCEIIEFALGEQLMRRVEEEEEQTYRSSLRQMEHRHRAEIMAKEEAQDAMQRAERRIIEERERDRREEVRMEEKKKLAELRLHERQERDIADEARRQREAVERAELKAQQELERAARVMEEKLLAEERKREVHKRGQRDALMRQYTDISVDLKADEERERKELRVRLKEEEIAVIGVQRKRENRERKLHIEGVSPEINLLESTKPEEILYEWIPDVNVEMLNQEPQIVKTRILKFFKGQRGLQLFGDSELKLVLPDFKLLLEDKAWIAEKTQIWGGFIKIQIAPSSLYGSFNPHERLVILVDKEEGPASRDLNSDDELEHEGFHVLEDKLVLSGQVLGCLDGIDTYTDTDNDSESSEMESSAPVVNAVGLTSLKDEQIVMLSRELSKGFVIQLPTDGTSTPTSIRTLLHHIGYVNNSSNTTKGECDTLVKFTISLLFSGCTKASCVDDGRLVTYPPLATNTLSSTASHKVIVRNCISYMSNPNGKQVQYYEDSGDKQLLPNVLVPPSCTQYGVDFAGTQMKIKAVSGMSFDDILRVDNKKAIVTSSNGISVSNVVIGNITEGTLVNANDTIHEDDAFYTTVKVTLNGDASPILVQQFLRSLCFRNSSKDPTGGVRIISFQILDRFGFGCLFKCEVNVIPEDNPAEMNLKLPPDGITYHMTFTHLEDEKPMSMKERNHPKFEKILHNIQMTEKYLIPMPLLLFPSATVTDPDTVYFKGGSLQVRIVHPTYCKGDKILLQIGSPLQPSDNDGEVQLETINSELPIPMAEETGAFSTIPSSTSLLEKRKTIFSMSNLVAGAGESSATNLTGKALNKCCTVKYKGFEVGVLKCTDDILFIEFNVNGYASISSVQALLRRVAFLTTRKGANQVRHISVSLCMADDTPETNPTLHSQVKVKVTPPLFDIPFWGCHLLYREGSGSQKLITSDIVSADDFVFDGGSLVVQIVSGLDNGDDELTLKESGLQLVKCEPDPANHNGEVERRDRDRDRDEKNIDFLETKPGTPLPSQQMEDDDQDKDSEKRVKFENDKLPDEPQDAKERLKLRMRNIVKREKLRAATAAQELLQRHAAALISAVSRSMEEKLVMIDKYEILNTEDGSLLGHLCIFDNSQIEIRFAKSQSQGTSSRNKARLKEVRVRGARPRAKASRAATRGDEANARVKKRELVLLLRNLLFENISNCPNNLNKVIRITARDGKSPSVSQACVTVTVQPINDATVLKRKEPDKPIHYRKGSQQDSTGCPILSDIVIFDPDTNHFNGGYLVVEKTNGGDNYDALSFLTPEQQEQQYIRRAQYRKEQAELKRASERNEILSDPSLPNAAYRARSHSIFISHTSEEIQDEELFDQHHFIVHYDKEKQQLFFNDEPIADVIFNTVVVPPPAQPSHSPAQPLQPNTASSLAAVQHFSVLLDRTIPPEQLSTRMKKPCVCVRFGSTDDSYGAVSLALVQYICRCVSYCNTTPNSRKLLLGSRSYMVYVNAGDAADGMIGVDVDVHAPLLWLPVFAQGAEWQCRAGAVPIFRKVSVEMVDQRVNLTQGCILIEITKGFVPNEDLLVINSVNFQVRDGLLYSFDQEDSTTAIYLGTIIVHERYISVEFDQLSKMNPRFMQQFLRAIMYTNKQDNPIMPNEDSDEYEDYITRGAPVLAPRPRSIEVECLIREHFGDAGSQVSTEVQLPADSGADEARASAEFHIDLSRPCDRRFVLSSRSHSYFASNVKVMGVDSRSLNTQGSHLICYISNPLDSVPSDVIDIWPRDDELEDEFSPSAHHPSPRHMEGLARVNSVMNSGMKSVILDATTAGGKNCLVRNGDTLYAYGNAIGNVIKEHHPDYRCPTLIIVFDVCPIEFLNKIVQSLTYSCSNPFSPPSVRSVSIELRVGTSAFAALSRTLQPVAPPPESPASPTLRESKDAPPLQTVSAVTLQKSKSPTKIKKEVSISDDKKVSMTIISIQIELARPVFDFSSCADHVHFLDGEPSKVLRGISVVSHHTLPGSTLTFSVHNQPFSDFCQVPQINICCNGTGIVIKDREVFVEKVKICTITHTNETARLVPQCLHWNVVRQNSSKRDSAVAIPITSASELTLTFVSNYEEPPPEPRQIYRNNMQGREEPRPPEEQNNRPFGGYTARRVVQSPTGDDGKSPKGKLTAAALRVLKSLSFYLLNSPMYERDAEQQLKLNDYFLRAAAANSDHSVQHYFDFRISASTLAPSKAER